MRSIGVCAPTSVRVAVLSTALLLGTPAWIGAVPMTLVEALDRAVQHTARGRILRGQADVAAQRYRALRINYLVPEVSINGSVPAFDVDEDYRFFGVEASPEEVSGSENAPPDPNKPRTP